MNKVVISLALIALIGAVAMVASLWLVDRGAPTPATAEAAVFVGAGDIAECPTQGDEETAMLLDEIVAENPDAVIYTTGDIPGRQLSGVSRLL